MATLDLSPLLLLRLRTPRLELRLPSEEELAQLAGVAERGVHPSGQDPFLVPWLDAVGSPSFVLEFARYHLGLRKEWQPGNWRMELGVWAEGVPMGVQVIHARNFARDRAVFTGSWLGRSFQGVGYGTEMRVAVLELAFAGLGAFTAGSGALEGNIASARIAAKLGYVEIDEQRPLQRGLPVREHRFLLRREQWGLVEHPPVEIAGLEACCPLFGLPA